jgi:ubiquitin C-terminal hydrolase
MFGLHNFRGSCWVNACLQSIFRLPEVQDRYTKSEFDETNIIDSALNDIWKTKGKSGLRDFFDTVKTETMPAGHGIGDTHELLVHLCDKLPFLDKLCRFKNAQVTKCNTCGKTETREDTTIEFPLASNEPNKPLTQCIQDVVTPIQVDDWKCETCNNKGCTRQYLIGSFPRVMMFNMTSNSGTIGYSPILVLNSKQYALVSVACYNGFHWWSFGRNPPPGNSWYKFDDQHIQDFGPKQFPLSASMRVLIYYRLEE